MEQQSVGDALHEKFLKKRNPFKGRLIDFGKNSSSELGESLVDLQLILVLTGDGVVLCLCTRSFLRWDNFDFYLNNCPLAFGALGMY